MQYFRDQAMGGYALIIPVEDRSDLLEQALNPKAGFLASFFGRKPRAPSSTDSVIDLPLDGINKVLSRDYEKWIRNRLSAPWESTAVILSYLEAAPIDVYVRAERDSSSGGLRYYVQVGFSACAGTADVSAEVAWHWAAAWLKAEKSRLALEVLQPRGFKIDDNRLAKETEQTIKWATPFLPLGIYGYGSLMPQRQYDELFKDHPPEDHAPRMNVDPYWVEEDEKAVGEVIHRAEAEYGKLLDTAGCHCQLCKPDLDVAQVAERLKL